MQQMVTEAVSLLTGAGAFVEFGRLLQEGWLLKKSLTEKISLPYVDDIYATARKAGAIGGKLIGAGGGGFLLICAEPEAQAKIRIALKELLHVPFRFESHGSQIIFYQPNGTGHAD